MAAAPLKDGGVGGHRSGGSRLTALRAGRGEARAGLDGAARRQEKYLGEIKIYKYLGGDRFLANRVENRKCGPIEHICSMGPESDIGSENGCKKPAQMAVFCTIFNRK